VGGGRKEREKDAWCAADSVELAVGGGNGRSRRGKKRGGAALFLLEREKRRKVNEPERGGGKGKGMSLSSVVGKREGRRREKGGKSLSPPSPFRGRGGGAQVRKQKKGRKEWQGMPQYLRAHEKWGLQEEEGKREEETSFSNT